MSDMGGKRTGYYIVDKQTWDGDNMKNFNVFWNCWFAGEVTVATLVDKNKRVSLRCKLNS